MVRLENQGGDLTLEVEFCLIYRQMSSHVNIIQKNRTTLVPGSFQQFSAPGQEPLILTNLLAPSLRDGVFEELPKFFLPATKLRGGHDVIIGIDPCTELLELLKGDPV